MGQKGVVGGGILPEQVKTDMLQAPIAKTATFSSDPIDTLGYGFIMFLIQLGAMEASTTLDGLITECDTEAGVYADCVLPTGNVGEVTAPQKLAADADSAHGINFDCSGHKRWVKYKGTIGGGGGKSVVIAVATTMGGADYLPTE